MEIALFRRCTHSRARRTQIDDGSSPLALVGRRLCASCDYKSCAMDANSLSSPALLFAMCDTNGTKVEQKLLK